MAARERLEGGVSVRLREFVELSEPRLGPEEVDVLDAFPEEDEILATFHDVWARLEEHLELNLTSEEALDLFPDLVVYDIPDGTRSTLTVSRDIDVGTDAGLYLLGLMHTLKGLGARECVVMTHTVYNRARGAEGVDRIFRIIARGAKLARGYTARHGVNVHWVGMHDRYELRKHLLESFPLSEEATFDAHFLIDYREEVLVDSKFRRQIEALPEVDVTVRHTKFNMAGGGWIPGKMLRSAFLYSQNGSLLSNWDFDELTALSTLSLLAKLLHHGEGLAKMYGDIDEVKRRFQLRELRLYNERIELRPRPRKLFVLGSPIGLLHVYY